MPIDFDASFVGVYANAIRDHVKVLLKHAMSLPSLIDEDAKSSFYWNHARDERGRVTMRLDFSVKLKWSLKLDQDSNRIESVTIYCEDGEERHYYVARVLVDSSRMFVFMANEGPCTSEKSYRPTGDTIFLLVANEIDEKDVPGKDTKPKLKLIR